MSATLGMDVYDIAKQCSGKGRYPDEDAAKRVALRRGRQARIRLRAYACHLCGGYHLTRQRERCAGQT